MEPKLITGENIITDFGHVRTVYKTKLYYQTAANRRLILTNKRLITIQKFLFWDFQILSLWFKKTKKVHDNYIIQSTNFGNDKLYGKCVEVILPNSKYRFFTDDLDKLLSQIKNEIKK